MQAAGAPGFSMISVFRGSGIFSGSGLPAVSQIDADIVSDNLTETYRTVAEPAADCIHRAFYRFGFFAGGVSSRKRESCSSPASSHRLIAVSVMRRIGFCEGQKLRISSMAVLRSSSARLVGRVS